MTGSRRNLTRDKVCEYLRVRIGMLIEERAKNDNQITHMIIDKCLGELYYVMEMIERESTDS
jgi:hypothetical protein